MSFTHDWFSHNTGNWAKWLSPFKDSPITSLEIGCYEGRATCWLLENILTHPQSRIIVVDTFEGSEEHNGIDFSKVRAEFESNVRPWHRKVSIFTGRSEAVVRHFTGPFELAYIDGSHCAPDVITDACLVWPIIGKGGLMIFDDYGYPGVSPDPRHRPQLAIDAFLEIFSESLKIIAKEYQVCLQKT